MTTASIAARETLLRPTITVLVSLAAASAGLTLLYLGMRAVMDIGGACAEGGPFVPRQPCPDRVPLLMITGIWGGIIACGAYAWQTSKYRVPSLIALAWPALFLSLGWNFLDYGFRPPVDVGIVWGWVVCGIMFVLMGGLPLLVVVRPVVDGFRSRARPAREPRIPGPAAAAAVEMMSPLLRTKVAKDAAASARGSDDLVSRLERLAHLHRTGDLSDDEYEAAKQSLLRGES